MSTSCCSSGFDCIGSSCGLLNVSTCLSPVFYWNVPLISIWFLFILYDMTSSSFWLGCTQLGVWAAAIVKRCMTMLIEDIKQFCFQDNARNIATLWKHLVLITMDMHLSTNNDSSNTSTECKRIRSLKRPHRRG